jgi:hypothetical protein
VVKVCGGGFKENQSAAIKHNTPPHCIIYMTKIKIFQLEFVSLLLTSEMDKLRNTDMNIILKNILMPSEKILQLRVLLRSINSHGIAPSMVATCLHQVVLWFTQGNILRQAKKQHDSVC